MNATLGTTPAQKIGAQTLPRVTTLLFLRQPIRILNRTGETWLVVNDLYAALGMNPSRIRHWKEIPEMERDIDLFDTGAPQKSILKIVTLEGLPILLKNAPAELVSKINRWAQISLLPVPA